MKSFKIGMAMAVSIVVTHALNGFMLSTLWEWFVLPVFPVSQLEFLQAIGICIVVNFLVMKNKDLVSDEDCDHINDMLETMLKYSVYCGLLFCTSWIVKTLM